MSSRVYKIDKLQNETYTTSLEQYDYLPYFILENQNKNFSVLSNLGTPFVLHVSYTLTYDDYKNCIEKITNKYIIIFITYCNKDLYDNHYNNAPLVYKFGIRNKNTIKIAFIDSNSKILKIWNDLENFNMINYEKNYNIPINIINDIFTNNLRLKILENYYKNYYKYPDNQLELLIDNKILKSLLPEISKIYCNDYKQRELYEILCLEPNTDELNFERQKNYIRKLTIIIKLNDNLSSGSLEFKDYNNEVIKLSLNCALVFSSKISYNINPPNFGRDIYLITHLLVDQDKINNFDIIRDQYNLVLEKNDI